MRRMIMIAALLITCSFAGFGQQRNNKSEEKETVKELVQKVDRLEHDLMFLNTSYDLKNLDTDLKTFLYEIRFNVNDLSDFIHNDNYTYELCKTYDEYYGVIISRSNANRMLYETRKSCMEIYSQKYSFTEPEKRVLESCCKSIEKGFSQIKLASELYKKSIDIYKEGLNKSR